MVSSADRLATSAGIEVLRHGGNAVDAALATNAVMAVVAPHLCGMGGDLFALVHTPTGVFAVNGSGRAGSGSDAAQLRREGHAEMPLRLDVRTVTVPGCVDGWLALHGRFGSRPLHELFAAAVELADNGFPASPLLTSSVRALPSAGWTSLRSIASHVTVPGATLSRPGVARTLRAIGIGGRDAFYGGEFGRGLLALGRGLFTDDDLANPLADWVQPLSAQRWGHTLYVTPPNSQAYLLLGAAGLAEEAGLPDDPDDPQWAHLLAEASRAAGRDRPEMLHEDADGEELLRTIAGRGNEIDVHRAAATATPGSAGDTTYLCAVDRAGMGVSIIQSNASGFGSWLMEPSTGINLHNRGLGFNLIPGHPAELAPRMRPPHTLCAAVATRPGGDLAAVFGTMGGDAQPQILLQVAARLFAHHRPPREAIAAARWALVGPVTGFDTWTASEGPTLLLEDGVPAEWSGNLAARGHRVRTGAAGDGLFGHAHAIVVAPDGACEGAADPRTRVGAAAAV